AKAKFDSAGQQRLVRYQRRRDTGRQPAARSTKKLVRSLGGIGGTRSIASDRALTVNVTASMANTHPGPATATRIPDTAGPNTQDVLRVSPMRALACCRCVALTV